MWETLLIVAVKLVAWFLDKNEVDAKIKKNYFEWLKVAGKDIGSAKLMAYGDKQDKWFSENEFKETD